MNKKEILIKIKKLKNSKALTENEHKFLKNTPLNQKTLTITHYQSFLYIINKYKTKKKVYTNIKPTYEHKYPALLENILRDYQKEGVGFLESKKGRGLIADEMGLGKSIQAIAYLALHPELRPAVIVCPATLKLNWQAEIKKWIGETAFIINGTSVTHQISPNINIINYDIIGKRSAEIMAVQPKVIICDESHKLKNKDASRTKYVTAMSKHIPSVILLSGSPIENFPVEIWTTIDILSKGQWNFYAFANEFCDPKVERYGTSYKGAKNLNKLQYVLNKHYMIRRLKKDVLTELPEKRYTELLIEISNRKEYNVIETDFISFYEENVKVLTKKAKKAEFILKRNELQKAVITGKMSVAIKWIENFLEEKKQIVVFTKHILPLTMLKEHFKNDIRLIYGAVDINDRNTYVNMFQKGKLKIIAGNSAMSEGLTMTNASDMLFIEFAYSPMKQAQREDRIHRIGQKENVMIYKMIASNTVDEAIIAMQRSKNKVIQKTLIGENVKAIEDDDTFMINEIIKRRER